MNEHACSTVGLEALPAKGKNHHIVSRLCDHAVDIETHHELQAVDCGAALGGNPNPPLARVDTCFSSPGPRSYGKVLNQYQGGPVLSSRLRLPVGFGIPMEGKMLTVDFHFPTINGSVDGMTGRPALKVTLIKNPASVTPVSSLTLKAEGFIAARSVGRLVGSWILEQRLNLRFLSLHIHSHDLVTRTEVTVIRANGTNVSPILDQDPRVKTGVTSVLENVAAKMRFGDSLAVRCTINNTLPVTLRIQ